MIWITAAIFSAVFAGLTSILAKCGIKKTDSDLATALRTVVVLLFSWIMVFVVGSAGTIVDIEGKSLLFLILSGLATGEDMVGHKLGEFAPTRTFKGHAGSKTSNNGK